MSASDLQRIAFAPSSDHIHLWARNENGEHEYLFACDELCDGDNCVTADDLSGEREVSLKDISVERVGQEVTVTLNGVVSEEGLA